VIVVIAILAAISIVAYNGIQTRAQNNQTIVVVGTYAKALSLYAVDNGVYPSTNTYPCLGIYDGSGSCARLVTGASGCAYSGLANPSPAFDAIIAPYIGSKPSGSNQRATCNGDEYKGTYLVRNDSNPKVATIRYYLKGNVDCLKPGSVSTVSKSQADNTTSCTAEMPLMP